MFGIIISSKKFHLLTFSVYSGILVWAGYRYGQQRSFAILARKVASMTEKTYYEGRSDAEKDCRAGLIK